MTREAAKRILGHVVEGAGPAADKRATHKPATVAELCDLYLADAAAGRLLIRGKAKKTRTLAVDKGRIERHVKPLLGSFKVAAVTRDDVDNFMHAVAEGRTAARTKAGKKRGLAHVRGGKGTASRTVGLLGEIRRIRGMTAAASLKAHRSRLLDALADALIRGMTAATSARERPNRYRRSRTLPFALLH